MTLGLVTGFLGVLLTYSAIRNVHPWCPILTAFGKPCPPAPGGDTPATAFGNAVSAPANAVKDWLTVPGAEGATAPIKRILAGLKSVRGWSLGAVCATSGHVENSEHYACNAADISGSHKVLQAVFVWLLARAKSGTLPIHCIIWDRNSYSVESNWAKHPYSGPSDHTTHVHVSALPSINGGC